MLRLNFDSAAPAMELARDEAMLQWADAVVEHQSAVVEHENAVAEHEHEEPTTGLFRVWEFARPTVVLGRSSKLQEEVNVDYCEDQEIEILRRCTGGASVVGGPGCLMYSVVIAIPGDRELRKIDVAHDFVMQRVLRAVQEQQPRVRQLGTCDLTLDQQKFSGNSLRVARHHLLYHGTILMSADLDLVANCLEFAPRQPDYRDGRDHRNFIANIELSQPQLVDALVNQFDVLQNANAAGRVGDLIEEIAKDLLRTRYGDPQWHKRR